VRIKSGLVIVIILVVLFGGVYGSKALGLWDYQPANSSGSMTKSILAGVDPSEVGESHTEVMDIDGLSSEEIHVEGAIEVTGETTVAMVLSWGLTLEDIEAVVGANITDEELAEGSITIKALAEENGLSFGKVKTALNVKLSELSE